MQLLNPMVERWVNDAKQDPESCDALRHSPRSLDSAKSASLGRTIFTGFR
jgi:hypothetical protein